MYSTPFLLRLAKIILVTGIGLFGFLITFNNITDYYTNYFFVAHVMEMDSVFPDSNVHYRAIHSPFLFHMGYILIITAEALITICCLKGAWAMFRNLRKDAISFHAAKNWAIVGIIISILLWFVGFQVIAGEWFVMWQSTTWNGLGAAQRVLTFMLLVLILLHFKDE